MERKKEIKKVIYPQSQKTRKYNQIYTKTNNPKEIARKNNTYPPFYVSPQNFKREK